MSEHYIDIRWYASDVQSVRPDLDLDKCAEVLDKLDRDHDANEGINWIVIQIVADMMFPEGDDNA